jgi:hypothetical protein
MLDANVTSILQVLQSANYSDLAYEAVTKTYPELAIFTLSIILYVVFVWFFYRTLSKKDLFKLDISRYEFTGEKWKKTGSILLYVLKYFIVFPLYVGFWFAVLTLFMFVMAESIDVRQGVLISICLVSAIRVTSYLNEDLSRDLAKLVPFALLAIFLVNPNFFSWDLFMARVGATSGLGWEILKFLTFSILLEWALRIVYSVKNAYSQRRAGLAKRPRG